jgi:hypothetical protein
MALSKEQILGMVDLKVKEVEVPVWNDVVFIKQLSRGQQDEYMKRQFGKLAMKQQGNAQNIESDMEIFGHDTWIFAQGVCDENGKRLFSDKDVQQLKEKNGEAIGFVASEIVKFSGMKEDIDELEKVKN